LIAVTVAVKGPVSIGSFVTSDKVFPEKVKAGEEEVARLT